MERSSPRRSSRRQTSARSGEKRRRILEYRDRILRDDLLAQCANAWPLDVETADEERRAKKAKKVIEV